MHNEYIIHIIDDDSAVREAITDLVESVGLTPINHISAENFIENFDKSISSILVVDIRMNGMDGLELQEWLLNQNLNLPIIFITGHGDIPMAVSAIKNGAVDFIEKPFRNQTLLECIRKAIKIDTQIRAQFPNLETIQSNFDKLTQREKEVCNYLREGMQSKEIALKMNKSYRTIEGHRSRILHKMKYKTTHELISNLVMIK
tara:strand:+ start:37692 stop:38297 length:606 start_codon:yes stop_codon:yes gene_type:complete